MMSFRKLTTLFVLTVLSYACQKEGPNQAQDAAAEVSLKTVQSAFSPLSQSAPSEKIGAPNKNYNLPDWKIAKWVNTTDGKSYWKIPLTSATKSYRIEQMIDPYTGQQIVIQLPAPYLIAYKDSIACVVFAVVQDVPYADTALQNRENTASRFSGEVNLYDWNGEFKYGTRFKNGLRDKKITPNKSKTNNSNARTDDWDCTVITTCHYYSNCTWVEQYYGYVVNIEVRGSSISDDGMCFPPLQTPFEVLVSKPSNDYDLYNFICDNWTLRAEDWNYVCAWIEDPNSPNPNPNNPGGGSGGGEGDSPDQSGPPGATDYDPCDGKNAIQSLLGQTGVSLGMQAVRTAAVGNTKEWGTPVYSPAMGDATGSNTITPYSNNGTSEWNDLFKWQPGQYKISSIHNHPQGYPPSPSDIVSMAKGIRAIQSMSFPNQATRDAHVMWYMENVSVVVITSNYDYGITPKNWNELWTKFSEYQKNPGDFNDRLIGAELAHNDLIAGLIEVFNGAINVYRSNAGQNNFTPYVANSNPVGPAQPLPCN